MKKSTEIIDEIRSKSVRFDCLEDMEELIEQASQAKLVLLGEATHGTKDFYEIRAEISKRLIANHGFTVIAVEGDWPACFSINEYVKGYNQHSIETVFNQFNRWPTWMWANEEVQGFAEWLRKNNEKTSQKAGFYGIDVYSLWESMDLVINQLKKISPHDVEAAMKAFACFEPFHRNSESYAISSSFYGEGCTDEVVELLVDLQKKRHASPSEHEQDLSLDINSLVILNAERYYRAMAKAGPESWNIRDTHMVDALERIIHYHEKNGKEDVKVIVWEHNTHIGDARATDMQEEGLVNVGQLLREKYDDQIFAIGFGTHHGTVVAARKWGGKIETLPVPFAKKGSLEDYFHQAGPFNKYLLLDDKGTLLNDYIGHRAVGVVYNPEVEHLGNYVPTRVASRYDAFIYVDESTALTPIESRVPIEV